MLSGPVLVDTTLAESRFDVPRANSQLFAAVTGGRLAEIPRSDPADHPAVIQVGADQACGGAVDPRTTRCVGTVI